MKKKILVAVSDTFFLTFISFIISFIVVDYLIYKPYSIILSICIALLFGLIFFKLLANRVAKKHSQETLEKDISKVFYQLCFESKEKLTARFMRTFNKNGYTAERKKGGIYLSEKKVLIFIKFGFDSVQKSDIVKAFNCIAKNERAVIMAETFSDQIRDFTRLFDGKVLLVDGQKAYLLLQKANELPKITVTSLDSDNKKAPFIKNFFAKKSAKRFFIFGTIFVMMSFFVPLKLYYVISGTAMLILSAICLLFGKPKGKEN